MHIKTLIFAMVFCFVATKKIQCSERSLHIQAEFSNNRHYVFYQKYTTTAEPIIYTQPKPLFPPAPILFFTPPIVKLKKR